MTTGMDREPGLILLDKPAGLTSFQALSSIKRILGTKKVGHCGTLDRFASGLLIVLTGKATKAAGYFSALDKTYRAEISFGGQTTTLDPEGETEFSAPLPDPEVLRSVISSFTGTIEQVPPKFSAVHVGGKRAYRAAMAGEEIDIPPRTVTIHSIRIHDLDARRADITVHCSKGTYIRSLARDIAIAAETRGTVRALRRVSIGGLSVADAVVPTEFDPEKHLVCGENLARCLPACGWIEVPAACVSGLSVGRLDGPLLEVLRSYDDGGADRALLAYGGRVIAMVRIGGSVGIEWVVPDCGTHLADGEEEGRT